MSVEMAVYVQNADTRKGDWVDLYDFADFDDFWDEVQRVVGESDGIHIADVEGPFPVDTMGLRDMWDTHEALSGFDGYVVDAATAYLAYHGWDLSCMDRFEDAYAGEWDSLEDYAIDFYESCYGEFNVPGYSIAVDIVAWECDHYTVDTTGGTVYVFRNV